MCVFYYLVEGFQCNRLAAAMGCSGSLNAELCCSGHRKIFVRSCELGIRLIWFVTLDAVDIWTRVRLLGLDALQ